MPFLLVFSASYLRVSASPRWSARPKLSSAFAKSESRLRATVKLCSRTVLWLIAVLSNLTVIHRMIYTYREAKALEDAQLRSVKEPVR